MGRFYKNISSNSKQDEGPRVSVLDSRQQYRFAAEKCIFFCKKSISNFITNDLFSFLVYNPLQNRQLAKNVFSNYEICQVKSPFTMINFVLDK